jgi:nucleoside-diphosphate kinase
MVKQLSSGLCLVLEVSHLSEEGDSVSRFRELVGPSDPDLARSIRPESLRARYGKTKDENALHCTDLPEDGQLEIEYFFKILQ